MYNIIVYSYKNKVKRQIAFYSFIKKEDLSKKALEIRQKHNKWNNVIEFKKMF